MNEISIEELKTRKLMVATPMYGGQCYGLHTRSILDLTNAFNQLGMHYGYLALYNESLITRARNYCTDEFLRSDASHLLFIDADIEFTPHGVLDLLALADPKSDMDIVCGPYPKKNISWEKVYEAVNQGKADQNPGLLEQYIGDYVLNPLKTGEFRLDQPIEVSEAGTGFMLIQRRVFETIIKNQPELLYTPDHIRSAAFDGSREIGAYFQDPIVETKDENGKVSKRHLSEDYYFCHLARKHGFKVHMCPWIPLNHLGYYKFTGNFPAVVSVAHPTADPKTATKDS